ncbi:unnamed protein product [Didymodactylos carnosus]|uniref:Uncharacterized protein n=1 Tax=Didymodactylos carnosus TaxID=1234261 RepID=A0A814W790_9BILA|nr:unnamed protein product [Didymodactylos carnosus]CAF1197344.1 unnamed protein product [Didymodactylos carnosus]CAF3684118.1 unnamed protein product [Didymodactylos carnosus]CAF3961747.1 unnamed protein product [Didymodactylos carnosus]
MTTNQIIILLVTFLCFTLICTAIPFPFVTQEDDAYDDKRSMINHPTLENRPNSVLLKQRLMDVENPDLHALLLIKRYPPQPFHAMRGKRLLN